MTETINVLLVEDEPILAAVVKETLELRGFSVRIATNGVEGWAMFKEQRPDVCVIDVMMPRKSGYELVEDIRKVDEWLPVVFLTAKTQPDDVLKGLEIGADDYMKKPFSMEELILRLKRLSRRSVPVGTDHGAGAPGRQLKIGIFEFDPLRLELRTRGEIMRLSQRESEVLELLVLHKGALLDRNTALLKIWGDTSPFNARSMDVYVTRLRKFLSADPSLEIQNVRGRGYKLIE